MTEPTLVELRAKTDRARDRMLAACGKLEEDTKKLRAINADLRDVVATAKETLR